MTTPQEDAEADIQAIIANVPPLPPWLGGCHRLLPKQ